MYVVQTRLCASSTKWGIHEDFLGLVHTARSRQQLATRSDPNALKWHLRHMILFMLDSRTVLRNREMSFGFDDRTLDSENVAKLRLI